MTKCHHEVLSFPAQILLCLTNLHWLSTQGSSVLCMLTSIRLKAICLVSNTVLPHAGEVRNKSVNRFVERYLAVWRLCLPTKRVRRKIQETADQSALFQSLRELWNRSLQKLFPWNAFQEPDCEKPTWTNERVNLAWAKNVPSGWKESSGYHHQLDLHKVFDTASLKILSDKSVRYGLGRWNTK